MYFLKVKEKKGKRKEERNQPRKHFKISLTGYVHIRLPLFLGVNKITRTIFYSIRLKLLCYGLTQIILFFAAECPITFKISQGALLKMPTYP